MDFKIGTKIGEDIMYGKHLGKARACHQLHCSLQVLYKRQFWLEKKWNWWAVDRRRVWKLCFDERLFDNSLGLGKTCFFFRIIVYIIGYLLSQALDLR